jgi:ABC-type Fe3+/spermidine/putrescine transport system ATPase subunit
MVAGFEAPSAGRIFLRDRDITSMPAGERGIAMVFQNYALFPRMTVAENVAFGLETKRLPRREIDARVADALESVHLAERGGSPVSELSGGEQQRVAVARAVVVEPAVLLFDEPLSNLDVTLRASMRKEIKELQSRLGITTLYVTHDQAEALSLSTRLAIMRSGELLQVGTPLEAYERPASPFVAEFLGGANLIEGRFDPESGGFATSGPAFNVPHSLFDGWRGDVIIAVKPGNILPVRGPDRETITGIVETVEYQGLMVSLTVAIEGLVLKSTFPAPQGDQFPARGERINLRIDWKWATVYRKDA